MRQKAVVLNLFIEGTEKERTVSDETGGKRTGDRRQWLGQEYASCVGGKGTDMSITKQTDDLRLCGRPWGEEGS